MQQQATQVVSGGTPSLFLVFLILKLTGTIGWSWWWVTAPLWGGLAFFLAILLIGLAGLGIWWLFAR